MSLGDHTRIVFLSGFCMGFKVSGALGFRRLRNKNWVHILLLSNRRDTQEHAPYTLKPKPCSYPD